MWNQSHPFRCFNGLFISREDILAIVWWLFFFVMSFQSDGVRWVNPQCNFFIFIEFQTKTEQSDQSALHLVIRAPCIWMTTQKQAIKQSYLVKSEQFSSSSFYSPSLSAFFLSVADSRHVCDLSLCVCRVWHRERERESATYLM